mgnify:CR=1 FL=1
MNRIHEYKPQRIYDEFRKNILEISNQVLKNREAWLKAVAAGMEWFCGFILMVTLVWIYLEGVKLCFRLAILFGNRR